MGMLTEEEKQDMALAHGKLFTAVCDDCGRGIKANALYVVLKYTKHRWEGKPNDKPFTWNSRVPKKVRCLDCDKEIMDRKPPVKKLHLKGKGKKKLTADDVKNINPMVKRIVIHMLKKTEEPIENKSFKTKVFFKAKKKEPKIKKSAINTTLRLLRKAKAIRMKKGHYSIIKQ